MQEVRPQGKHCSYNAFAFPPSVEVRWGRYDSRDGGGRAKQELEPRAKQEPRAESNAGAIADDCRDAGGRAMQEQLPSRRLVQYPG